MDIERYVSPTGVFMQDKTRLKYNANALRQFDTESALRCVQAQDSARARKHFQSNELRFDIIYAPDEAFTEFLLYVREHTTEFTCHHKKFYWHVCPQCRRDSTQARALREYHRERVLKVLAETNTHTPHKVLAL